MLFAAAGHPLNLSGPRMPSSSTQPASDTAELLSSSEESNGISPLDLMTSSDAPHAYIVPIDGNGSGPFWGIKVCPRNSNNVCVDIPTKPLPFGAVHHVHRSQWLYTSRKQEYMEFFKPVFHVMVGWGQCGSRCFQNSQPGFVLIPLVKTFNYCLFLYFVVIIRSGSL
jgi:hypothetical protein